MRPARAVAILLPALIALIWAVPFLWMLVASFRPGEPADIASLLPAGPFGFENYAEAIASGHFLLWYANTILLCGGILLVQCVTVSLAGYALARIRFRGASLVLVAFLLQLLLVPTLLIVPNLATITTLHLYDHLAGIAAPYLASAFGTFLMRQTFRSLPRDYEDAARIDGASRLQVIRHVLLPMARPALTAFAIVSVTSHWNEFLWPLIAVSSPDRQVLTVGLASFASSGEAGGSWGLVAAGTLLVAAPLLIGFLVMERRFVSSFVLSGIK